jgi:cytochrome c oxidase cbb3-type subunit 3
MYEKFARTDVAELAKNPEAMAVAQKLFLNNCAQCHASDGGGSRGFPNLTDRDWLWGGSPETIKQTITEGRTGVMPPWGPQLGEEGVKDVANYVMSMSGYAADSLRAHRGKAIYEKTCFACHGADGKGNQTLGAPNLTDKTGLHGSGVNAVMDTGPNGRTNQMPAHRNLLSAAKIHLLTAYVLSLSR